MNRAPTAHQLAAEARAQAGDKARAAALWQRVLDHAPDHPEALNAIANWHLSQGEASPAELLLVRAIAAEPGQAILHFNLATAVGALGRFDEALRSLDAALVIDPYFVQALFHKAAMLSLLGRQADAAAIYRNYLDCMPPEVRRAPHMARMVRQAEQSIEADNAALRSAMASVIGEASERVVEAMRLLTDPSWAGATQPSSASGTYIQQPTFMTVPCLPAIPFFDERDFPWLAEMEAATQEVIAELTPLMRDPDHEDFEPYVARAPGAPVNQWGELNHSRRWSAFHLWENGVRRDANCARCPRTAALVERLPLIIVPDRAPNAFFSVLRAGARIPPHTGVTNMRATIHLGLIVPLGCGFRVGGETREWRSGKAWAFDDTIEHEAWNDSGEDRVVLIVDGWNPYIDASEHAGLKGLLAAYDRHRGLAAGWAERG